MLFEILFLNRHPKGPKLSAIDIANYLKITDRAVNICLKRFETCDLFKNMDSFEKIDADTGDVEETIESMEEELKSLSLSTWPSTTTLSMTMTEAEDKERNGMISINYTKWIKVCKNDWYDKLEKMLSIRKSAVTIKDVIDDLYSIEKFSDHRHDTMMKAIDREVRFKNKVEPLKFYVSNSSFSHYSTKVTMENFKILLEEILADELNAEIVSADSEKLVWVTKLKWITICKNEWYEKMEQELNFDKTGLQPLDPMIGQLYSIDLFSDEKHDIMMKAVDRELKFKNRVKPLKVYPGNSYNNDSYYSATVSVKNFELVMEDILDASLNNNA